MSEAPNKQPQQDVSQAVRQAVEAHIGTLTCQAIELSIQVQNLSARNQQLEAEIAELRAPKAPAEDG